MIVRSLPWICLAFTAQAAEWPAHIDWSQRTSLSVPVQGIVESVSAYPGQVLKKGETMAALAALPFKAGVAEARADTDRLTEEETDARRDLDRVRELYARTVSATTELDAAKLRLARAVAGLAAAQARLERARWLLAESELRAPFDLVVLSRQAEPGMVVTSQCQATPLFSVARADELLVRASLDSSQIGAIHLGDPARVEAGSQALQGRVQAIAPQQDGHWSVDVVVAGANGLIVGDNATLRLP